MIFTGQELSAILKMAMAIAASDGHISSEETALMAIELMRFGVDEEKTKKMQQLYIDLIQDDDAKRFFEAETKFNVVLADVNKIIGEAIKDVL